jgi:DNA-binding CsgD family transcriptional regulator
MVEDASRPGSGRAGGALAGASLGLTQRETEVLALVAESTTNRQIGERCFINPKTASVHVSRIR